MTQTAVPDSPTLTDQQRVRIHAAADVAEDMVREDRVYSEPLTPLQFREHAEHIRFVLDDLAPGRRHFQSGRGNYERLVAEAPA